MISLLVMMFRCTERREVKEDVRRAVQTAAQARSLIEQYNL